MIFKIVFRHPWNGKDHYVECYTLEGHPCCGSPWDILGFCERGQNIEEVLPYNHQHCMKGLVHDPWGDDNKLHESNETASTSSPSVMRRHHTTRWRFPRSYFCQWSCANWLGINLQDSYQLSLEAQISEKEIRKCSSFLWLLSWLQREFWWCSAVAKIPRKTLKIPRTFSVLARF